MCLTLDSLKLGHHCLIRFRHRLNDLKEVLQTNRLFGDLAILAIPLNLIKDLTKITFDEFFMYLWLSQMKTVQLNHVFDFHLHIQPQLFWCSRQSHSRVSISINDVSGLFAMGKGFVQVYGEKIPAHLQFLYFLPALSPGLPLSLLIGDFLKCLNLQTGTSKAILSRNLSCPP